MSIRVFVPFETTAIALGANALVAALDKAAQTNGADIEIIRNGSRGLLWAEPMLEVATKKGRVAYKNVSANDVESLFDADFLNGGEHEKSLGLTEQIPYLKNQQRVIFNRCGLIDPLNLKDFVAHGGFNGLKTALCLEPEQIIAEIAASGLRGRGGAAFPAAIKWQTVLDAPGQIKHIVCNADEGDSGTFADRLIMEGDPFRLIEAMIIAGLATKAEHGVIYLRSEYPVAEKILRQAIALATKAGWLGDNIAGSNKNFKLEIFVGAGSYVCGEETALLESLEGKRPIVRNKPPLPAISGLFGQPTLVNNVLTLCAVPDILERGGQWHAKLGVARSTGTMAFQLAGDVKKGGLVEVPFGLSLRQLVEDFGGLTRSKKPLRAVQVGGPLGAYLPQEMLDLKLDYEAFAQAGAGLGHGGIVLFNSNVDMRQQAQYAFEFC
ncbi:NAD-dependent formate dehydrogenase beta subunit, partial [hydrothermal vent metagenome]